MTYHLEVTPCSWCRCFPCICTRERECVCGGTITAGEDMAGAVLSHQRSSRHRAWREAGSIYRVPRRSTAARDVSEGASTAGDAA